MSIHVTLISTSTPSQSGPGNNGNKFVPHIPQSFEAGASPSDGFVSYLVNSLAGTGSYPFCRDAVAVF